MLRLGQGVFISCITYYEIKRGLLAVNATRQLSDLEALSKKYEVLLLDNWEIIEKAAEIYANLKRTGTPIQDADILIAATAITQGLTLVSADTDMLKISNLTVENWLRME